MKSPDKETAKKILNDLCRSDKVKWANHSRYVALAAETIALKCGLDKDAAYSMGLLHDIGRGIGAYNINHTVVGYRYMQSLGYDDIARICCTHAFVIKDITSYSDNCNLNIEDKRWLTNQISFYEYNDYDKLIQLCDSLAIPEGCCILEKRLVDVSLRHGINNFTLDKWKILLQYKEYFEKLMGCNLYVDLPSIIETTLGFSNLL